jgi:amino acid permease
MNPKFITVSAKQGDPSILWIGASGLYYRTKEAAVKDDPTAAYPYKSPLSMAMYVGIATVCIVAIGIYLYVRFRKK